MIVVIRDIVKYIRNISAVEHPNILMNIEQQFVFMFGKNRQLVQTKRREIFAVKLTSVPLTLAYDIIIKEHSLFIALINCMNKRKDCLYANFYKYHYLSNN